MTLPLSADRFLKGSDDPWWNESAWFGFSVPTLDVNGFFYFWHRPNMRLTAGGVALWDARGTHRDDCLAYHWFPFNPMPADAEMFSFSLSNGMAVETLEPLQSYRLLHRSPTVDLDLTWTGLTPAFEVTFGRDDAAVEGTDAFGGFHYEQFGRVTGTVTVDGQVLEVDGPHVRDRSWGVRRPFLPTMRGGLEMAWASDRTAFCATMITPDADSLSGGRDHLAYGMMLADGVLSRPVRGHREVVERAPDGRPLVIAIELEDRDGRRLDAVGRTRNCLKYDDLWFVHWSLVEWTVAGEPAWGESQDMAAVEMIRGHQRAGSLPSHPTAEMP